MAVGCGRHSQVIRWIFSLWFVLSGFFDLPQIFNVHLPLSNFGGSLRPWRFRWALWPLLDTSIILCFSWVLCFDISGWILYLLDRNRQPLNWEVNHIHDLLGVDAVRVSTLRSRALRGSWALVWPWSCHRSIWAHSVLWRVNVRTFLFQGNAVLNFIPQCGLLTWVFSHFWKRKGPSQPLNSSDHASLLGRVRERRGWSTVSLLSQVVVMELSDFRYVYSQISLRLRLRANFVGIDGVQVIIIIQVRSIMRLRSLSNCVLGAIAAGKGVRLKSIGLVDLRLCCFLLRGCLVFGGTLVSLTSSFQLKRLSVPICRRVVVLSTDMNLVSDWRRTRSSARGKQVQNWLILIREFTGTSKPH